MLLVRTVMELAACGVYNLRHSFNIDTSELRDTPSLAWPEATIAATPPGACEWNRGVRCHVMSRVYDVIPQSPEPQRMQWKGWETFDYGTSPLALVLCSRACRVVQ